MKKFSLIALLAFPALTSIAAAQTAEHVREYGVNLGLDASRTWSNGNYTQNSLNAGGSFLFLNEHFHVGPTLSFSRNYSSYYDSTSWGLGVLGKWTYENIQTADRTPFVELSAGFGESKSSDWKDMTNAASVAVGYETFLNPYVSFAPSIIYSKSWTEMDESIDDGYDTDDSSSQASTRLRLGLNIYL